MNLQQTLLDPKETRAKLVDALELQSLALDEQDNVIEQVLDVIMDQTMIVVLSQIPADEHDKLEKLLEAGQMDAAQAYVQKNVPNVNEIINDVFELGVEEYKRIAKEEAQKIPTT